MTWYNENNAEAILEEKIKAGEIDASLQQSLQQLLEDGYCVLEQAVPADIIDQINADFDNAPNNRERILLRKGGKYKHPGPLGIVGRRMRVIDFYVPCHAALQAVLAKPVTDILNNLYGEPALAFQSLLFQFGSKQDMHQDPAYVVIDQPDNILASWIALEDIQPGSGALQYYKGSHRNIHYTFDSGKDIWDRASDSMAENKQYASNLSQLCEDAGLEKETFFAKKGDLLIWHANLVHGGGPVTDEDLTRKSLVTHYCPHTGRPNFFNIQTDSAHQEKFNEGYYASRHYDIKPESNNPYPVFTGGENIAEKQGLSYD